MEVDGIEKEILQKLCERQVMSKEEIMKIFGKGDVAAVENALKSLLEKGYATNLTPLVATCFAVTTKGIKILNKFTKNQNNFDSPVI